ncbi:MAG: hypothetical protein MK188_02445 [Gammaproteobacteria bacterium]|nr:hypothetical protein [Gammaproteobacteria bacterium]
MKKSLLVKFFLAFSLIPTLLLAQTKVVVVPLIGDDSQLKPISPTDLVDARAAFTTGSQSLRIFTVTNESLYVLSSILVAPEQYPATRRPISIRFCKGPGGTGECTHAWKVPNDNVTKLDFGIGEIFDINATYYLDITDRGGLPENVGNQIIVQVSAYRVDK